MNSHIIYIFFGSLIEIVILFFSLFQFNSSYDQTRQHLQQQKSSHTGTNKLKRCTIIPEDYMEHGEEHEKNVGTKASFFARFSFVAQLTNVLASEKKKKTSNDILHGFLRIQKSL